MILRAMRLQTVFARAYPLRTLATKSVASLFDRGFVKEVFPPDARFVLNICLQFMSLNRC